MWSVAGKEAEGAVLCKFGLFPKKGKPGRWHLIVNLSAPEDTNGNDGIDKKLASVSHTLVEESVAARPRCQDCQGRCEYGS